MQPQSSQPEVTLVIGPNASMSPRLARWVLGGMTAVAALISGFSLSLGFWMVIPFAGLELFALAAALAVALRRNHYREVLEVSADVVRLRKGPSAERATLCMAWPRAWVRAVYCPARGALGRSRLELRYAGQVQLLGEGLSPSQRASLARRLWQLLPQAAQGAAWAAEDSTGESRYV